MPIISKAILKTKFETGDQPTQLDFENLIDSCYNQQTLDWVYQQYIPDNLIKVEYTNGGITTFMSGMTTMVKKMFIPIPNGAKKVKSIRLFGQGVGQITNMKLLYYTDFNFSNPALNPTSYFPGMQYTLLDQDPTINISLGFPLFDETITVTHQDLDYNSYRFFSLHLTISTPPLIFGNIYLKPFGIEYE